MLNSDSPSWKTPKNQFLGRNTKKKMGTKTCRLKRYGPPVCVFFEINSKLSLIIGGFMNILLIWLVCKRTPKEMRIYSKILLQVCFSDLANLIVNDLVQPVSRKFINKITLFILYRLFWSQNRSQSL
jgi:hypothetical protein